MSKKLFYVFEELDERAEKRTAPLCLVKTEEEISSLRAYFSDLSGEGVLGYWEVQLTDSAAAFLEDRGFVPKVPRDPEALQFLARNYRGPWVMYGTRMHLRKALKGRVLLMGYNILCEDGTSEHGAVIRAYSCEKWEEAFEEVNGHDELALDIVEIE